MEVSSCPFELQGLCAQQRKDVQELGATVGMAVGLSLIQGKHPPRVMALDVSNLAEEEEEESQAGSCSFSTDPGVRYVWDPSCAGGGLGCKADGIHDECKFCGFGPYDSCGSSSGSCTVDGSDPYVTGSHVNCCSPLQQCLGYHGTNRNFYLCLPSCTGSPPAPAPPTPAPTPASTLAPSPAPPTCTGAGSDPWQTGSEVGCCSSLQSCLGKHGTNNWFYLCLPECPGSTPTPAPVSPSPGPAPSSSTSGAGSWPTLGSYHGSGWCRAEIPTVGWNLKSSCGSGPTVKVLTYNLFWWNLYGRRGGNGESASRLIQANGPYDIMGFQECDDISRVLHHAGLSNSHHALVGSHATAIAFDKGVWQKVVSGNEDVAEDRPEQYYGRRGAGWARLRHRASGRTVFVVNHHGPLPVNTGGKCGGEATAYNMLRLVGQRASAGDEVILLGDLNADVNSATQRVLKGRMHRLVEDWVDAVFASCPRVSSRNLGNGGSDHDAIEAVLRL